MIHNRLLIKIFSVCLMLLFLYGCNIAKISVQTPSLTTVPESAPSNIKPAGAEKPLEIVGQIGGQTQAVAVAGNFAYVGVGFRMTILDISDTAKIQEMGSTEYLGGKVEDITVDGSVAYLAAGEAGLFAIDISDALNPKTVCQYDSMGYAEGVAIKGANIFLADGPDGLIILETAENLELKEVGKAYSYNYVFDVAIKEDYAYIAAAGAGMLISNISDTAKPTEEGSIYTPGYAYGIAISGNTAFIADGWEGLYTIDIREPSKPKALELCDTYGWAMDVAFAGDRLYVAAANGGLRIFDASNSKNPKDLGYFAVEKSHFQTLAVSGNTVYAADTRQGIHIIDASEPAKPKRTGFYSPMGYAQAIDVSNGYAYVAAQSYGVRVIDLADPTQPREVGTFKYGNPFSTLAISGNTAYAGISFGLSKQGSELYAIDITDPLNLKSEESVQLKGQVTGTILPDNKNIPESIEMISRNLIIEGSMLYNSGEKGLLMIDISEPMHPVSSGLFLTTEEPTGESYISIVGAVVASNYAYLAASFGGLLIVDISDPKNLKLVGTFNEQAKDIDGKETKKINISDVVVSGAYSYIVDNGILRAVDVSDPEHPKDISMIYLPSVPNNAGQKTLAVDGNMLFIADNASGLVAVDITDPKNMKIEQQLPLTGHACWITLDKDYVYVAAEEGGVYIVGRNRKMNNQNTFGTDKPIKAIEINALPDTNCFSQYKPLPLLSRKQYKNISKGNMLTVTSTNDDGKGSFRYCLNAAKRGDIITFDAKVFPAKNPATIYVISTLELGQEGVTVDASNAGVILDGSKNPDIYIGFNITGGSCIVKGLQIQNFPIYGMNLGSDSNIIGGDSKKGAAQNGEGNVINGSKNSNLFISGVRGNLIKGNIIGLDSSGKKRVGDFNGWGITIQVGASNNRIQDNTIAGFISVSDLGSSYNEIIGNRIGTDITGTTTMEGNQFIAVCLPFNRIGGTGEGEGNTISGTIFLGCATDTVVVNNMIGVDASGTKSFEMYSWPVDLSNGSSHNIIGGATIKERNIINCLNGECIHLSESSCNNFIIGNNIGADALGNALFCDTGIQLSQSGNNTIQGNIIAGAKWMGVNLENSNSNLIRGNQLLKNLNGLSLQHANSNIICDNEIIESQKFGIEINESSDNMIFNNAFLKNASDGYDKGKNNAWDNGFSGNFWDRYTGTDANQDGIGDNTYMMDNNITDKFPLMLKPLLPPLSQTG